MLNLGNIPFSEESVKLLELSATSYWRFGRIKIETRDLAGILNVVITQTEPAPNGKILTHDELIDRAKAAFDTVMPEGYSYVITAQPFQP